jgi:hypothetical protein
MTMKVLKAALDLARVMSAVAFELVALFVIEVRSAERRLIVASLSLLISALSMLSNMRKYELFDF